MQRDSIYKSNIRYIVVFVLLVIYESISSIYPYLTPLFGVAFYYILSNINKRDNLFIVFLSFLYLLIFEVDKGFIPFSFMIFFIFYYFFIYDRVEHFFVEKNYKIFFHVFIGYVGYYIVNVVLKYLFNQDISVFDYKYFLYIVTDFLILVVL